MWIKDESGKLGDNNPTRPDCNSGLKKHYNYFTNSNTVELLGRIHADAFTMNKLLLNHSEVKVKFTRQNNDFCLMAPDTAVRYKIKIEDAKLFVRRVHVAPTIQMAHNIILEKSNAKFRFTKTEVKVLNITVGSRSISKDNLFLDTLPKQIILF
jgi:hypothetical protein